MISLTAKEYDTITFENMCPDCGAKGKFLAGPCGGASQNITCSGCHMRFNVGPGSGERLGKEERLRLDPISIGEGTMAWSKYDAFEYLSHSCGGSLDLHTIDHETSALLCRKCGMRQVFKDQRIVDLKTTSYKVLAFFEYIRDNNPLVVASQPVLKRMKHGCEDL